MILLNKNALYKRFENLVKATHTMEKIYNDYQNTSNSNEEVLLLLGKALDTLDERLQSVLQDLYNVIEQEMLGEDECE